MKIPFDIKYRPQIDSGEYKVETEEGSPARIICWDSPIDKERPIIAIVFDDQIEQYKADGHYDNDYETSNYDLFVIIPEPEFSEFEKGYMRIVHKMKPEDFNDDGLKIAKEEAAELLELAKNEILRSDKWIIGNDALRLTYERGKAEALKDLPRWKKCEHEMHTLTNLLIRSIDAMWIGAYVKEGQYYIPTNDLILKLPGFKEDEK